MSKGRRRALWRPIIAGLALAGVAFVVWGLVSYVGLVRLHVQVTDASSRLEAASRERAQLAANVLHAADAFSCLGPARLTSLRRATERVGTALLAPGVLEAPGSYREFLRAQDDLTAALRETWLALRENGDVGARLVVEDLHSDLEQAHTLLLERIGELEGSVGVYRDTSAHFPGSVVAGMAQGEAPAIVRSWFSGGSTGTDVRRATNPS